jgi:hypothetical protein
MGMKMTCARTLAAAAFILASSTAWAAKPAKKKAEPKPAPAVVAPQTPVKESAPASSSSWVSSIFKSRWYAFAQAGGIVVVQGSGGNTFSGIVSWNPTFNLTPSWAVRGNLGMSVFKGTGRFFVAEYELLGAYSGLPIPLMLEAGAGAQTWFGNGGTSFIASANGAWKLKTPVARFIDRVYAGYTACFFTDDLTHQIRAGIGLSF